jgi:hypothetical protein
MDAVTRVRLDALEARCAAAEQRLHILETQQRLLAEQQGGEAGERLELSDRLADIEKVVFPPAPPEQPS